MHGPEQTYKHVWVGLDANQAHPLSDSSSSEGVRLIGQRR